MWLAPEYNSRNYSLVVDKAIEDETVFSNFKSDPNYKAIVGMSFPWQADIWYNYMKENKKEVISNLKKYSLNDTIGNPEHIFNIKDDIFITPSTLRYINTAMEIEEFFNFKNKIKVCELGVGYGGLSYVMNCHFDVSDYCLLDLPNVQKLAKKYLNQLGVTNTTFDFIEENDIFVSEFCLSEFDDEDIYNFHEKYLLKSKNLYLTMNLHEEDRKKRFLDKLKENFDFEIKDEFPKTQWPNYIIRGSRK
jgi:putative sugar O-methyltransferase